MGRPREFDKADVVERALETMWAQGYEATSIDDLCRASGLSRSSLYETFGSKQGVLLAALEQYQDRAVGRIGALFERYQPVQRAVEIFLMDFVDSAVKGPGRRGCFLGNCALELGVLDATAAVSVARGLDRIEDVICTALRGARARGEIADTSDARALARFLTSTAQGLRLVAKAAPERAKLVDIVRVAVSAIR